MRLIARMTKINHTQMTKLRFAPVVLCCSSCSSWLPVPSGGPGLPASESWMRCVLPHGKTI